jgi:hypothetical protein
MKAIIAALVIIEKRRNAPAAISSPVVNSTQAKNMHPEINISRGMDSNPHSVRYS